MTTIETTDDGNIVIHVQMALRHFSGRKKIIFPDDTFDPTQIHLRDNGDRAVLVALARAHHWKKLMDEGKCKSSFDIATKLVVDAGYVRKILRLNDLSPKIVQRFLNGTEPNGLSQKKLMQSLPYSWEEQEKMLLGC